MQVSDARALGQALIAAADKADAAGQDEIELNVVLSHAAHAKVDGLQALADLKRAQQQAGPASAKG